MIGGDDQWKDRIGKILRDGADKWVGGYVGILRGAIGLIRSGRLRANA